MSPGQRGIDAMVETYDIMYRENAVPEEEGKIVFVPSKFMPFADRGTCPKCRHERSSCYRLQLCRGRLFRCSERTEHFHVCCSNCGWTALMATADDYPDPREEKIEELKRSRDEYRELFRKENEKVTGMKELLKAAKGTKLDEYFLRKLGIFS